jgi:hypothetical protein
VLAVRDLEVSTRYYVDILRFQKDPIDAKGWSFLTRDSFRVMLGECADETASGAHQGSSWLSLNLAEPVAKAMAISSISNEIHRHDIASDSH